MRKLQTENTFLASLISISFSTAYTVLIYFIVLLLLKYWIISRIEKTSESKFMFNLHTWSTSIFYICVPEPMNTTVYCWSYGVDYYNCIFFLFLTCAGCEEEIQFSLLGCLSNKEIRSLKYIVFVKVIIWYTLYSNFNTNFWICALLV